MPLTSMPPERTVRGSKLGAGGVSLIASLMQARKTEQSGDARTEDAVIEDSAGNVIRITLVRCAKIFES